MLYLLHHKISRSIRAANFFKALCFLTLSSLLSACHNTRLELASLAAEKNHTLIDSQANGLPVTYLQPNNLQVKNKRLRVYIEGDGRAWITQSQPSLDPTPKKLLVPYLAINDPTPNIYLARPCQFNNNSNCSVQLWTSARFGTAALTAMHQSLTNLKQQFGNNSFELIGYSGGATIALLLAAQRDDIEQVQTIAGNLSPTLWTATHNLTPLDESLDPLTYSEQLSHIKQRHFVGGLDSNTSLTLYKKYLQQVSPRPKCYETIIVSNATHTDGWEASWQKNSNLPIQCLQTQQN